MNKYNTPLLVFSNCSGPVSAKKIAKELISKRLAACVNILPKLTSYFEWGGKLEVVEEHMLIIKTTKDTYPALEKRILEMHDYDIPEIIAIPIEKGFDKYLEWLQANTLSK